MGTSTRRFQAIPQARWLERSFQKKASKMKEQHKDAPALTEHLRKFFNAAFGRNVRSSRLLLDHVSSALSDGYSEDEIRIAFWVARCSTGKSTWLCEQLRSGELLPHIVLRHHGRLNNVTGKEAKRWLDELLARAGEVNMVMVTALLDSLPAEMRPGEEELLARMELRGDNG